MKSAALLLCWIVCVLALGKHHIGIISTPASASTQSNTISYQVHSYNDLNEWPQILRKDTVYFKIDPHYMDHSFCVSQKRLDPADPRGCFVLNHDDPITSNQYNSTNDVLSLISDPRNAPFFRDSSQKITIALCFKYGKGSPCDGSDTAKNWTSLVDTFYNQSITLINALGLNVEFVLDGSGTPSGRPCLNDKWRPWVSTWIPSSDPEDAAFSNNVTLGYDRYQVFNPPEVDAGRPSLWIDYYQKLDYGKFSNGTHPYLLWEPSSQNKILEIANAYATGPIHSPGFRFAINIDPAMLEVYAGSASGVAWNYNIVPQDEADNPQVDIIPSGKNSSIFYVLTIYFNATDNLSHYVISSASSWEINALGPVNSRVTSKLPSAINVTSVTVISPSLIFVSAASGAYATYSFSEQTMLLSLVSEGSFPQAGNYASRTNAFVAENTTQNEFVVVQLVASPHLFGCQLYAQLWQFSSNSKPTTLGDQQCIQSGASVDAFDLAVLGGSALNSTTVCAKDDYPGIVMYTDTANVVYAAYICIDLHKKAISVNGYQGQTRPVYVDFGSVPSVSLIQHEGEVYVFSVHGEGYCWNNEVHNKQPNVRLCDNNPSSMPYILVYNFGRFNDWAQHITQQLTNKNPVDSTFGSCHSTILHGAYDTGSNPTTALFTSMDPNTNTEVPLLPCQR
jgi:hypothetical protein